MAKRINALNETISLADQSYFVVDGYNTSDTTNKVSFNTIKNKIINEMQLTTSAIIHIVKFVSNSTYWYRVWSNGWCEQGGKATTISKNNILEIIYPIPYVDDNVFITATPYGTDLDDAQGLWYQPSKKLQITKDHFYYANDLAKGEFIMWRSEGMVDLSKI